MIVFFTTLWKNGKQVSSFVVCFETFFVSVSYGFSVMAFDRSQCPDSIFYEDMIDHRSYVHNLRSYEIKA